VRRMDIINRGLSGYNTAQALEILPKIIPPVSCAHIEFLVRLFTLFMPKISSTFLSPLEAFNLDFLTVITRLLLASTLSRYTNSSVKLVLFGANDACIADAPTRQHVPLQIYKQNLKTLVTHPIIQAHHPKIILATPPPIDEIRQEETDATRGSPLCRRANVTAEYADAVRQVATEVGGDLIVLDLWSEVMEVALRKTVKHNPDGPIIGTKELGSNEALTNLMPDGLHFGGAGYSKFFEVLLTALESKWPNAPPFIFPDWRVAPKAH
jgi:isoamyl acetate esterase